jgi:hypothetical protein
MKDLIPLIAKTLVDHPEQVSVQEVVGNHEKVLELEVAKVDFGKVFGCRPHCAGLANDAGFCFSERQQENGPWNRRLTVEPIYTHVAIYPGTEVVSFSEK